ncbi:unnamed protein product [Linum tenue]|nr:unnamed protein product [Linum tenue]
MEELGVQPSVSIVNMIGTVFQHRGMLDKYEKLKAKYPPPKWEFRYIKGKRVRIRAKHYREYESESGGEGGIKRMMRTQTKVAMRKRLVSARLSLRMSSTISWVETATVAVESRNEGSSRRGNDAPLHHISSPWKLMMPVEVRTSWDEGQILSFWTCRMPTRVEI